MRISHSLELQLRSLRRRAPSILEKIAPYLIMFAATCIPLIIFFQNPGQRSGDDSLWHSVYTYDLYLGMKNGYFGISPSHAIMGSLGYDIFLFYGPFPHYTAALLAYLFSWLGAQTTVCLKIVCIASVYLSGIFTYKLGLKVTGDKKLAIGFAIAYIVFPYRIWCFLYRVAISEGVAMGFIPMIFYGIYSLLHDEEFKVSSYISVILGVALIVMSHPFTALISILAAAIFALANPKKLANYLKKKTTWVALPISVLLIFGLTSFYLFPMLSAMSTNYYRITANPTVMWTTVEHLIRQLYQTSQFSGFLNYEWLSTYVASGTWPSAVDSAELWTLGIFFYLAMAALSIFILNYGRKKGKSWGLPVAILLMVLPLLVANRQEMVLATVLYIGGLIFIEFARDEKELHIYELRREYVSLAKNPYIYALVLMIIMTQIFLWTDWIWTIVPSIFLNAQFPFRFWSIFSFLIVFLFMFVFKPLKGKRWAAEIMLTAACLLHILSMSPIDKRITLQYNNGIFYSDDTMMERIEGLSKVGSQNEYIPEIFYDSDYESEYGSNSLYRYVKSVINSGNWDFTIEDYRTPAFLTGTGTAEVTYLNSPEVNILFTDVAKDAENEAILVQIPQFYYDGYLVTFVDENGAVLGQSTPIYVDGLLAFEVIEGSYTAEVRYVGSLSYRVALPFLYISIVTIIAVPIGLTVYRRQKSKRLPPREEETEPTK